MDDKLRDRYSRQILFAGIGEEGQRRLLGSSAVLVGCGAVGATLAALLVRAGVGRLRIVDRDFVEPSNLQRQNLFDEADARDCLPKAIAARRRLCAVNSDVTVEGLVADLSPGNAEELLDGFPLLLDGTDNFETRLLINDFAVSRGVPWIYSAVLSSYGVTQAIRPGRTACLACLVEAQPTGASSAGESAPPIAKTAEPTCDTVGVLGPAAGVVASLAAASALKLLLGTAGPEEGQLVSCDVWTGRFQAIRAGRRDDCRACGRRDFGYLAGTAVPRVTLCGRDSVQIHESRRRLDLAVLGRRLAAAGGQVRHNDFLLRLCVAPYELTVFADGRTIVKGTRDPALARSLYARYIGA